MCNGIDNTYAYYVYAYNYPRRNSYVTSVVYIFSWTDRYFANQHLLIKGVTVGWMTLTPRVAIILFCCIQYRAE